MKWSVFLVLSLIMASAFAENKVNWWERSVQAVDETTGISENYFSSKEKDVLQDYLRSQGYGEKHADRDDDDDDLEGKHKDKKGKKDKNGKKDKKAQKQKPLPKGLQKKLARGGELPPGWQKKIARGEVMDTEVYASSLDLPQGILDQLEMIEGTSVRQVEDHVVRVKDATGIILDVLTSN